MSMLARRNSAVPKETARVARSIYPEGNTVMRMLDVLCLAVADEDFADLFPVRGQPAESPARLALVTLLQFMEGCGGNYFGGVFAWGSLTDDQVMRSLDLFTRDVLPALRGRAVARA